MNGKYTPVLVLLQLARRAPVPAQHRRHQVPSASVRALAVIELEIVPGVFESYGHLLVREGPAAVLII